MRRWLCGEVDEAESLLHGVRDPDHDHEERTPGRAPEPDRAEGASGEDQERLDDRRRYNVETV